MVATLIGENGTNVLSRVVEAPVQEADHAPIPPRSTVEKTACPWDRVRKLGLAMEVLAQVNFCENKNFQIGGSWVPDKANLAKSCPEMRPCSFERQFHRMGFFYTPSDHRAECPLFSFTYSQ